MALQLETGWGGALLVVEKSHPGSGSGSEIKEGPPR